MSQQPVVALMYDFDKTLCTKNMQEYVLIKELGTTPDAFWNKARELTDNEHMDRILAYMYLMVNEARKHEIRINRTILQKMGDAIEFYPGVLDWFDRINAYGARRGLTVEHYIVSSGIKEIIEGTRLYKKGVFREVFACEFMYDYNNVIVWPKMAVNYTTKTQFLFRINKGLLDINTESTEKLNQYVRDPDRHVPFSNMIYIGDGITDVPCMKLVKDKGGQSIAVYPEVNRRSGAEHLLDEKRVNFIALANYEENGTLDSIVKSIIDKIRACETMIALQGA